ncbi:MULTISPECIES: hypothetical protein [Shewanella]|uniref:hypothetical protein n=1 Tax=Shewanella TaxID=22 RepID=UPI0024948670|nr:hypothetical protein [Shewanella japonica]
MLNLIKVFIVMLILSIITIRSVDSCDLSVFDNKVIGSINISEKSSESYLDGKGLYLGVSEIGYELYLPYSLDFRSEYVGGTEYFISIGNVDKEGYIVSEAPVDMTISDLAESFVYLNEERERGSKFCYLYNKVYPLFVHRALVNKVYLPEETGGPLVIGTEDEFNIIIGQSNNSQIYEKVISDLE